MQASIKKNRIGELDFLRGIALILMIYFHVVFDLKEFYDFTISYDSGINYYIGKAAVILFMLISGISCFLSRSNFKRGLKVLGIAVIISIVTHVYDPALGIKFGVLHFFGVSMMLAPALQKLNRIILSLLAVVFIYLGNILAKISAPFDFLFPLGLTSSRFTSSDYYPLLPWLGIFVFGVVLGKTFYKERKSLFSFSFPNNPISLIGRYTLLVYILHQQVILVVLSLFLKK